MMKRCDMLLMIGTTFPFAVFLAKGGQARTVQMVLSSRNVGMRLPTEVNLVGDSAETLRRLIPLLKRKDDRSWRDSIEKRVATWWEDSDARAMASADPINPQRVFWELSPKLPHDVILCGDCGSHTKDRKRPRLTSSH